MVSRPRRTPRWGRAALVAGLVLVLVAAGAVVGGRLLLDRWERAVPQQDLLESPGAGGSSSSPHPRPGADGVAGPLTYLVVGTDRRPGDADRAALADAIVIVHVPAGLREAYLISVPRDLRVDIPGHGTDKVNAAYRYAGGGPAGVALLADTLTGVTGAELDGAALLDFTGFEAVVDALGGVEMCLDRPVRSIHTGEQFPAGCQQLTGAQALDLARQRYGLPAGDLDRGRHHQRLIQAMVDQARSSGMLTDLLRLDRTVRAVGDAVTVDTGGVPLPELAYALRHLRPHRMTGITLPSAPQRVDGVSYVLPEPAADQLYRALRHSTLDRFTAANPRWRND